jgi:maleate isomerase
VVLETDQTVEPEIQSVELEGVAFYHSRIQMDDDVSSASLGAMEARLPQAAALLPTEFGLNAIGYACTSAATVIGADRVHAALQAAHPGVPATNPISAAVAAFQALGATNVTVITPYVAEVTDRIVDIFETHDVAVAAAGSFLEASDRIVARITEDSIADAVRQMVKRSSCDAAFVSCTSLRSYQFIDSLESELGIDVVSSNQAFLWHLLRLAGIEDTIEGLGRLFTLSPAAAP